MRIGLCTRGDDAALRQAQALGLRSIQWMGFAESGAGPQAVDWKPFAESVAATASSLGLRISALGAFYRNALDPRQTDTARATIRRAAEVAAHIGVRTISAFAGGVIRVTTSDRGGQPVVAPLEEGIPEIVAFWEPLADYAAERGVRIAFEHCPQGVHRLPVMHYNVLGQPANWERLFNATSRANLGIEWDPSHLVCQFIDPLANLRAFGAKVFHVHAKDARIDRGLLARHGICHQGVAEHRFPGFGDCDWAEIVHELVRCGYDSDLNIEGRHDPVYRDHAADAGGPLAGRNLEEAGIRVALRTLARFVPSEAV